MEYRNMEYKITPQIYIFGAHSRGQTLAAYLQYLHPEIIVEAYLYDNGEPNPKKIGDVAVIPLDAQESLHTDYPVYIGTRGMYHGAIRQKLEQLGFEKIYPVTVELDLQLRNAYLDKYFAEIGKEFLKIDKLNLFLEDALSTDKTVAVYVAKSILDGPLKQNYALAAYEKEIQVGAALTSQCLSADILTDCLGDNISDKNKQFCELTALYWIWKHAGEDIVGLVHYRRHFILPQNWLECMLQNNVDVILPVPLYVAPNIEGNFKSRHIASDWECMMQYLQQNNFKEAQEAENFFQGNLYSPCNMFIMRRDVLNRLCEWLFPILFAVAEHGGVKEDNYQNRYPGFISERLISFFFEKHGNEYKVVYSDKNFLV